MLETRPAPDATPSREAIERAISRHALTLDGAGENVTDTERFQRGQAFALICAEEFGVSVTLEQAARFMRVTDACVTTVIERAADVVDELLRRPSR